MYLLEKVEQRNTTRNRVDDWVLLLILESYCCWRSVWRCCDQNYNVGKPNQQTEYSTRVVILVDASLSMSQTLSPADDTTVLEWTKTQLMERLKEDQGQKTV